MTENEWMHGNCLRDMLDFVEERATPRELRLFACACCRRIWHLLSKDRGWPAVQVAERFADGQASARELAAAHRAAAPWVAPFMAGDLAAFAASSPDARYAAHSTAYDACQSPGDSGARAAEREAQLALARCIFGNPFRPAPAVERSWLAWDGGRVVRVARYIAETCRFEEMPVLADALEDAGCADAGLLAHCRSAEHARGCWVLDLLAASPREDEFVPEEALDYQEILRRARTSATTTSRCSNAPTATASTSSTTRWRRPTSTRPTCRAGRTSLSTPPSAVSGAGRRSPTRTGAARTPRTNSR
jgi:hypothetical protein